MPDLRLTGCSSRPLLNYLKALGVLRLVAEQADPAAALRWRAGIAELRSSLDEPSLESFFLERYAPSPVCSPWNGGSGFFSKDDRRAIETIDADESPRLAAWREAIRDARMILDRLGLAEKPADGAVKLALLQELRACWPDGALRWLDAAVVLRGADRAFPPLLGSGGNDGRYDIANNFAQAVAAVLGIGSLAVSRERAGDWLAGAFWQSSGPLVPMSLAHLQRQKSPVNAPHGEADGLANPWDLVLAVEGALVLTAGAARRFGAGEDVALSAPFTVATTAAGYGSAATGERARAELWLPLWTAWSTLPELEAMVREARAQVGRRNATDGLDLVRAAGELGVARGIAAFERYAILERAGQSNLALAAGRVAVRPRPEVRVLDPIDAWVRRVVALGPADSPRNVQAVARGLARALFAFADRPSAQTAQAALVAIGAAESSLARSGAGLRRAAPQPLRGGAARDWLDIADDGSAEFALAASLASLHDSSHNEVVPALRDYLHGTGLSGGRRRYDPPRRPALDLAAAPPDRLAALHARRHLDAEAAGRALPFEFGTPCSLPVVERLAAAPESLDLRRVIDLVAGLCLFDHREDGSWKPQHAGAWTPVPALRLLALAFAGTRDIRVDPRPGWVARLVAGRTADVLGDACLRLRLSELPPLPAADDLRCGAPAGRALASALLLPLSHRDRDRVAQGLISFIPDQGVPA